MIKVENVEAWGFKHAIRGMRNPMNSWNLSDSGYIQEKKKSVLSVLKYLLKHRKLPTHKRLHYVVGEKDLDLMKRLYKGGTEHRKYLRQIFVSMDITAPLYWWKEFDTYKIGTVSNSCSTMHKIAAKEFELDDFSHEHLIDDDTEMYSDDELFGYTAKIALLALIDNLNFWRAKYVKYNDKKYWWQMIQLLPSSYNQRRTITMNYENVVTMINQRTRHKLDEWNTFVDELRKLPYITMITESENEI